MARLQTVRDRLPEQELALRAEISTIGVRAWLIEKQESKLTNYVERDEIQGLALLVQRACDALAKANGMLDPEDRVQAPASVPVGVSPWMRVLGLLAVGGAALLVIRRSGSLGDDDDD